MSTKITKQYVENFITTLATGDNSLEIIKREVSPFITSTYIQNRGGVESNYSATISHLSNVRFIIQELKVEVLDLVIESVESGGAGKMASRHRSWLKRKDGAEVHVEVALFGEFDSEGKFTYMYEMTRDVT
jgi:hypothetical protein